MIFTFASRRFSWPGSSSELAEVMDDLKKRTLDPLPNDLSRLVCLASTRDYNTGKHQHHGLAFQYSEQLAAMGLEACSEEVFERLVLKPLAELTEELRIYFLAVGPEIREAENFWEEVEPYRVLAPKAATPLARKLFISNIRIALAVLKARWAAASACRGQSS